jgi:hypothetical protein
VPFTLTEKPTVPCYDMRELKPHSAVARIWGEEFLYDVQIRDGKRVVGKGGKMIKVQKGQRQRRTRVKEMLHHIKCNGIAIKVS